MRGLRTISIACWLALASLWVSKPLVADVTGTILGTVTDPSGAAIPGAKVVLTNSDTGLSRAVTTDSTGSYEFLAVPVGSNYNLEVGSSGFQRASQIGIKLLVNQKFRADFHLVIGAMTQSVNVTAAPVQVESTSTQLGDVIESSKMTAVPLNGRSYVDLLGLQAGVVPIATNSGGDEVGGNLSVNGQRENANSFQVNGATVERSYDNGAAVVPVLDSIQEFRLLTSSFDAEYGRFSGAVVNVITKSGTNSFHGNVFEFLRNDKLDARGFFDQNQTDIVTGQPIPGSALPKLERSQFGGTLGGAIKKNRLFFFGDYQGTRQIGGVSTGNIPVPSAAERNGDFSQVEAAGYSPLSGVVRVTESAPGTLDQVLTQRLGYSVVPGEPYWVTGCNTTADAAAGMCVFPGQVIPQSAWSPAAKGTVSFIPASTFSVNGTPYYSSTSQRLNLGDDTFEIRTDLNTQRTGNWMFYYHYDSGHTTDPYGGGNVPGFAAKNSNNNQNASISNTRNFGTSAVNEVHLGFTRSSIANGYPLGPFGSITQWGFVKGGLGIVPGSPNFEGLPSISLNQLGITFGLPSSFTREPNNVYQVTESFTKIRGAHTMKFGADARYAQFNIRQNIEQNGVFGFSGDETTNDFADYLIGAPDSYGQASNGFAQDARTKYFGVFAQDSWKIRPNLTLNYGLRYDISQPFYDTQNRIQEFLPSLQSTLFPNAPRGWVFPGDGGIPPTISPTDYKDFGPRIGLAYSPGFSGGPLGKLFGGPGKTSIRAAFGVYYTTVDEVPVYFETGDAPFGLFYVSPSLVYLEEPFKARTSSNDPGQRFPIPPVPATGSNINFSTWMPISGSTTVDPNNVLPRANHYNFNIQRQLTQSMLLTLAYVGSQGHHLSTQIEANPGIASRCLDIAALFTAAGNPGGGCGPFGEDSIYAINGQTFNGTRPYSVTSGRELANGLLDFGGTLPYASNSANSSYNSLQVTLEKKMGSLQLLGAYTWSKSLDNSSGFFNGTNPYNPSISKSLSAYDMSQDLVASYIYELPFGRLANAGIGHVLAAGWSFAGITRFATGLPVTLSESGDRSLCGCFGSGTNGVDLPNYDGQPIQVVQPKSSPNHQYFVTGVFSDQALGIPGNASRRFFHGPGLNTTDLALLKDTKLGERMVLQFRAEFFNVFNRTLFNGPDGDFNSSSFGQITGAAPGRIGQFALKLNF